MAQSLLQEKHIFKSEADAAAGLDPALRCVVDELLDDVESKEAPPQVACLPHCYLEDVDQHLTFAQRAASDSTSREAALTAIKRWVALKRFQFSSVVGPSTTSRCPVVTLDYSYRSRIKHYPAIVDFEARDTVKETSRPLDGFWCVSARRRYVTSEERHPLIVHGRQGSGKTCLSAHAVQHCHAWCDETEDDVVVVARFANLTPRSRSLLGCLHSIAHQCALLVHGRPPRVPHVSRPFSTFLP